MNTLTNRVNQRDIATRHRLLLLAQYRQLQKTFELQRLNTLSRRRLLQLRQHDQLWNWLAL